MMTRQELEALRDLYPPDTICIPGLIDSHLQALDDLAEQAQEIELHASALRNQGSALAGQIGQNIALRDQRDEAWAAVRDAKAMEHSYHSNDIDGVHCPHCVWAVKHARAIEEAKEVGDAE